MGWPPRIGDPLPRATKAWCAQEKLTDWILSEEGHGPEWNRIFRVTVDDFDLVWDSIAVGVLTAPVTANLQPKTGIGCEVLFELKIKRRIAFVVTAWHYADAAATPRLVTAYPKPYNRGNGSYG
jgi:hypothetical protein